MSSTSTTQIYYHLVPHVSPKSTFHQSNQHKRFSFHKFQPGTITTFNDYTNINNHHQSIPSSTPSNKHHRSRPLPTLSNAQHHSHGSRFHLLSRLPSRSPSPTYHHDLQPTSIKRRRHHYNPRNNNNYNALKISMEKHRNKLFNGLILSDSMLSRVRNDVIKKSNSINIKLSYESGCDCIKMLEWLRSPEGDHTVKGSDFLIFSLGTNDVGRYGVDVSLDRCSELIAFIRRSFPGIQAIGWMALSPRWKPTKFFSTAEIGDLHHQFNGRLQVLSEQLDFDVVDARLGPLDMRVEDGLHPSFTTGKWKYEKALRNWFSTRAVAPSSTLFQDQGLPSIPNYINNGNNDDNNENLIYMRHDYRQSDHRQNNNRQVIDSHAASRKDEDLSREEGSLVDIEEIPIVRPATPKYTGFLNITVNESDDNISQISEHSDISRAELDVNCIELDINDSIDDEEIVENKKKRKLRETSISPSVRKKGIKQGIFTRATTNSFSKSFS